MISEIEIKALAEMAAEIVADNNKLILTKVIKTLLILEETPLRETRVQILKSALEMLEKEDKQ